MPARRRPTRWLAPIAIVAVAAAGYGIARSNAGEDDEQGERPRTTRSTQGVTTERRAGAPRRAARRTYVVKAGDTLSAIALETGVPVARIEQLNEDVDVRALQPGERLKLRP